MVVVLTTGLPKLFPNVDLYRGTSLIRNNPLLGPYSRSMSRAIWWPWGGGVFLMSEVPLYRKLPDLGIFSRQIDLWRRSG